MKYTSLKFDAQLLYMDKPEAIVKELTSFLSDLKISPQSIAMIEVYAVINNNDDYLSCSSTLTSALSQIYKEQPPAHSLVAQKPVQNPDDALMRISICDENLSLKHKIFQKHHYSLIMSNDEKIILSGAISFNWTNDMMRNVQSSFDFIEQLLDHEEMHMGHIAHQVNYIEGINSKDKEPSTGWNNQQILDEIRKLYFDPTLFKHGYPVQTYANTTAGNYITSFVAAVKDGFPTAQFDLGIQSGKNETIISYVPGLNKAMIGNLCSESESSMQEQLHSGINNLKQVVEESGLNVSDIFDEIKITIVDENDLETVEKEIVNIIKANKLTILNASLKGGDKIEIEAFITATRK